MFYLDVFGAYAAWGMTILRFALGAIFIAHGIPKLFGPQPGIAGFTAWLRSMRVPLAGLFGVLVPVLEFFGGLALVVGFLVPPLAILFAVEMLVASILKITKMGKTFAGEGGWDFDLIILAGSLALLLNGAGAFALDALVG